MRFCFFFVVSGLDKEGIFRVCGDTLEIEYYKQQFDSGEDVVFKEGTDVHVITNLLKLYLREMPEPLLTYELVRMKETHKDVFYCSLISFYLQHSTIV